MVVEVDVDEVVVVEVEVDVVTQVESVRHNLITSDWHCRLHLARPSEPQLRLQALISGLQSA